MRRLLLLSLFLLLASSQAMAANRYWVGGSATWDATAGSKWESSPGAADSASAPGSGDAVFFDANSGASTVTVGISPSVTSVDATGFAGTLALGTNKITTSADLTLDGTLTVSTSGEVDVGGDLDTVALGGVDFNLVVTFTGASAHAFGYHVSTSNSTGIRELHVPASSTVTLTPEGTISAVGYDLNIDQIMDIGAGATLNGSTALWTDSGTAELTVEWQPTATQSDPWLFCGAGATISIHRMEWDALNLGALTVDADCGYATDHIILRGQASTTFGNGPIHSLEADTTFADGPTDVEATLALAYTSRFDMNGFDLELGDIIVGGGISGDGQSIFYVGEGALTARDGIVVGSSAGRLGQFHVESGSVATPELHMDNGATGGYLTGTTGAITVSGAIGSGTACTSTVYIDATDAGSTDLGTAAEPYDTWSDLVAGDLSAAADCVVIQGGTILAMETTDNLDAFSAGQVGSYGTGSATLKFASGDNFTTTAEDIFFYDIVLDWGDDVYACACSTGSHGSCVAGSDANDGRSPATAELTWNATRVDYLAGAAGARALFCEGGSIEVEATSASKWLNDNCDATEPCYVGSYTPDSGATGTPILRNGVSANTFYFEPDPSTTTGYVTFENLALRGTTSSSPIDYNAVANGWQIFQSDDTEDFFNLTINNVNVQGMKRVLYWTDYDSGPLTITNSHFENNCNGGILGGVDQAIITDNVFTNNAGEESNPQQHHIYLSDLGAGSLIARNTLTGNGDDPCGLNVGVAGPGRQCQETVIGGHGISTGVTVEDNYLYETLGEADAGCWGITFDKGTSSSPEIMENFIIRRNVVENVGGNSIALASCSTCLIENNVIVQGNTAFSVTGIRSPSKENDDVPTDTDNTDVEVRYNTILFYGATTSTGINLGNFGEGSDYDAYGNVIRMTAASGDLTCLALHAGDTGQGRTGVTHLGVARNNACSETGSGTLTWHGGTGTTYTDLTDWQVLSGIGVGSLTAAPGLTDEVPSGGAPLSATYDLSAATGSSIIVDAGYATSYPATDIDEAIRDASPDIGAYEWVTGITTIFAPWLVP